MIQITFTPEDIQALRYERYHHPHPRVQQKMEALWLKSQGLSHHQIAALTGISVGTLHRYLLEYAQGGIDRLKQLNFRHPTSRMMDHRDSIEAYFREHPPQTINEAIAKIEALTGIKRSPTQVRVFLTAIGMRCRKVAVLPAKADADVQEEFKKKELDPRLQDALDGKRAVFFGDAAHFVFGCFLGYLWCFVRLFVRAPAGRERFNVLGALNAVTHELVMVTNTTYINAQSVCDLLRKIAALGLQVPITLVLDNARYQRCALVQEVAAALQIELLFLPSYSPNLNLMERFWKYVKKQCLYSRYYENFTSFREAIAACCQQAHLTHAPELDTLLTLRFQSFSKQQVITV